LKSSRRRAESRRAAFRQKVERVRKRPTCRTITISRQGAAQRLDRAAVLQKQGSGHGRVTRVGVNGGPMLRGVQENFSERAILEPANAGGVPNAAMLEVEQLVPAPSGDARARSLEIVQAVTGGAQVERPAAKRRHRWQCARPDAYFGTVLTPTNLSYRVAPSANIRRVSTEGCRMP
jgi:hypothetical protein